MKANYVLLKHYFSVSNIFTFVRTLYLYSAQNIENIELKIDDAATYTKAFWTLITVSNNPLNYKLVL